jgi:AcrR family transcriptional regulator
VPVASTRDRFIASTLELFRRQGYNGTSLSQVTAAAGAPTGSLYHHFNGGKDELTVAVLEEAGVAYGQLLEAIWDAEQDPVLAISAFFEGAAVVLEESDFVDPCPIGTVAREIASSNDVLRRAALGAFDGWMAAVRVRLVAAGLEREAAEEFAIASVAAIEGGFVVSRTARDADLLRATGRRLAAALKAELDRVPTRANRR